MPFAFDPSYTQLPDRLFRRVQPTPVPRPSLLALNGPLAHALGLTVEELTSAEGLDILAGSRLPQGADPLALAYAGHQFGHFVPQLGDGRAILLGEVIGRDGLRRDVQWKGSGPTPFSRGGDGRAALGPVLREYVVSEAMAALGVPTTRALAAVQTGAPVYRDSVLPGAVLVRVAASHLRIGTFQYFAVRQDHEFLSRLVDYALARHYPEADLRDGRAVALLEAVMDAQARLVAHWLGLGFVHGVMNTDNMAISGETLDYGPCAFLDGFDPDRTFSSIDHGGRYAYANQSRMAQWNLARLAETLVPLVDDDPTRAVALLTERLDTFGQRFEVGYLTQFGRKLGLREARNGDLDLVQVLLGLMASSRADFTISFRRLTDAAATGDDQPFLDLFLDAAPMQAWIARWRQRLAEEADSPDAVAGSMRRANPAFIARNHGIEGMIAAALQGDLQPMQRLGRVLAHPYDDQPDAADLALPPDDNQWQYRTFCGT